MSERTIQLFLYFVPNLTCFEKKNFIRTVQSKIMFRLLNTKYNQNFNSVRVKYTTYQKIKKNNKIRL